MLYILLSKLNVFLGQLFSPNAAAWTVRETFQGFNGLQSFFLRKKKSSVGLLLPVTGQSIRTAGFSCKQKNKIAWTESYNPGFRYKPPCWAAASSSSKAFQQPTPANSQPTFHPVQPSPVKPSPHQPPHQVGPETPTSAAQMQQEAWPHLCLS